MIRPATAEDVPALRALLAELAAYEQAPEGALTCTEADLRRDGFGADPRFTALLAEHGGRAVGFLIALPSYSSWVGRPSLVIHDLYVREEARGLKLGEALVRAVARLAVERGCARVDVNVLHWNRARAFYERLGFRPQPDWVIHRLDGTGLTSLARNG